MPQRRVWAATDPGSRCLRRCDALDADTPHQRLDTDGGAYWVCERTGQLEREEKVDLDYDASWRTRPDDPSVQTPEALMARYEPYRKLGRMFEVGVGRGDLLAAAQATGWEPAGNDVSAVAAEQARARTGVDVQVGAIEATELEPAAYDVVLLNNVFEHLRRPGASLRKLAAALRPGGALFLQTLNAQSLSLAHAPTTWRYFGEGHLFIPTLTSLAAYCERAGLSQRERTTHGYRGRFKTWRAFWAARTGRGHRVRLLAEKS